jgi:hypothetical protein
MGEKQPNVSAELAAIFAADQADRRDDRPPLPWPEIQGRDRQRRARVAELVQGGELRSAEDYFHAAIVFQHGETAEHLLWAHVLATVAGFKGHPEGPWLTAASLDRFLQEIGRPQILGGNYRQAPNEPVTQEPYDRSLPDSIREAYGIPSLAEQAERLAELNRRHAPAGVTPPNPVGSGEGT